MVEKEKADKNLQNNNASQNEKKEETSQNNNESQQNKEAVRIAKLELKTELYKEVIQNYEKTCSRFKWFVGTVITMFIAMIVIFIGYFGIWKEIDFRKIEKEASDKVTTLNEMIEKGYKDVNEMREEGYKNMNKMLKEAKVYLDLVYCWHGVSKARKEGDLEAVIKFYDEINILVEEIKGDEAADAKGGDDTKFTDLFPVSAGSITTQHIPIGLACIELSEKEQDEQNKQQLIKRAKENIEMGIKKGEATKSDPALDSIRDEQWFKDI